jgi:hypothetical protein
MLAVARPVVVGAGSLRARGCFTEVASGAGVLLEPLRFVMRPGRKSGASDVWDEWHVINGAGLGRACGCRAPVSDGLR